MYFWYRVSETSTSFHKHVSPSDCRFSYYCHASAKVWRCFAEKVGIPPALQMLGLQALCDTQVQRP